MYADPSDGRYDLGTLTGDVSADGKVILLDAIGGDWQLKTISDALRHLTAMPKIFKHKYGGKMHVPLTWAIVTQIAKIAELKGFRWKPEPNLNQWILDEFTRRFTEHGDMKFDVSGLDRTPMPHQAGRAFVAALNERFFFADEMGAGKTASALLTLLELRAQGKDPFPAVIVCPAAVIDPWMEEIEAWGMDLNAVVYQGSKRRNLSTRYDVYVMSWDVFRLDMQQPKKPVLDIDGNPLKDKHGKQVTETDKEALPSLLQFFWDGGKVPAAVVYDEAHALCNVKTKQSVAARNFAKVVRYAFPMSGTPITKNIAGFWSALNVLDIRSFPDQERFKERYTDRHQTQYEDVIEGLSSVNGPEFHTLMQGSMGRVAKADIMKDLPPKRYSVRYVEIPPAYRAAYTEMEEDMLAHMPDSDDEPLPAMSTLAQLTRLSQLASSACDVKVEIKLEENEASPNFGMEIPHYTVTMREPSWKIDALMDLLDEMQGSPLVCFSPSTQLVKLAGARAEKEGYKVGYIVGGQSKTQRTTTRKAFQAGELDLLCCNTAAGGVGLTLTAADTLVFLNRPWSYTQSAQAEDRIHRRGQEREAQIIDIIAKNTIEDRVRTALKDKAKALSELVRDPRIVKEILGGL